MYFLVHSYLISEMLNHALADFYKVLILIRKGGRHTDLQLEKQMQLGAALLNP